MDKLKKQNKAFIKMAVGNLIAIPLIGATAGAVNTLPTGTAKSIAKITPGLQSVALVGYNVKFLKNIKPKMKGGKYKKYGK